MNDDAMRNLLRVLNIPDRMGLVAICRTSDGHYLGQEKGDLGYNVFIGQPAPVHEGPGLENTRRIWASLTAEEKVGVRRLASNPPDGSPIPLEEGFGVPGPDKEELTRLSWTEVPG